MWQTAQPGGLWRAAENLKTIQKRLTCVIKETNAYELIICDIPSSPDDHEELQEISNNAEEMVSALLEIYPHAATARDMDGLYMHTHTHTNMYMDGLYVYIYTNIYIYVWMVCTYIHTHK